MEGVLLKWTNYFSLWRERKFTIKGAILSYYAPEIDMNKPKRRIFLGLVDIIEPELENKEENEFGFEINTGGDHYYIRAKDNEEKQKWLNAIKNGKILGEKLIRESNKNLKGGNKNDNKFEQFKKIYNEKIKNLYKNKKEFQIILKQFDNIINFIEGKNKLELFKINETIKHSKTNINEEIINTDININSNVNENLISINSIKKENENKNKVNNKGIVKLNNNKNKNKKNVRVSFAPKTNQKRLIEKKPGGRLTVSLNSNFTDRGYLLKGEEFFDMDESFSPNKDSKFGIKKIKSSTITYNENLKISNGNNKNINKKIVNQNIKKSNIGNKQDTLKGSFYDPLYSYERRTSLPEQYKEVSINLFKLVKDAIGKDINHFAVPVFLNEPLSMLQKLCENFQYADLLNKAANEPNPHLRLAYVACFNIGGLTMNIHRAKKLFNPLLFETYEYIDNKLNYRFFAEQVSHHPAISAFFAEGEGWNIFSNNNSKIDISITGYVDVKFLAKSYVNLTNYNDEINYTKPITKVKKILSEPVLDLCDKFYVKNNEGDECIVNFIPNIENIKNVNVNGEIKDIEGNITFKLEGNWCDKIKIINMKNKEEKIIWEYIKSADKNNYYFQPISFDLNNLTEEMKKALPKTDSRFRQDQRLMEYQKFDEAGVEKNRLEEKQRKQRKENEKNGIHPVPRYFEETYDDISGELIYKYKGNYFDDRKNKNFKDIPDIFGQ